MRASAIRAAAQVYIEAERVIGVYGMGLTQHTHGALNIAMLVNLLLLRGQAKRILVVDLDVHQGNGSARIFHNDPSVFTLSLHGARNFPFRKEPSDCDIDLPDGCTDAPYLAALEQGLAEVERRCEPALVSYLAGADPHEGDRLGRLRLSDAGMAARDQRVFDWAWQRQLPVAMAMAGGYGHDIQTTVRVQLNTYRIAQAAWARWQGLPAR